MSGQNDRQDRSLTGQIRNQAGHCPLTSRYFQPCTTQPVFISRKLIKDLKFPEVKPAIVNQQCLVY